LKNKYRKNLAGIIKARFLFALKMEWNDVGGGRIPIDFLVNKTF